MSQLERITKLIKAGLAFVEAMEAGSSGYVEDRVESLEKRVMEIEESLRRNAASSSIKHPASTPNLVG